MRTALQRIGTGALAYVASYVLIGLVTVSRIDRYLDVGPGDGRVLGCGRPRGRVGDPVFDVSC
ncbi:hypothetical protein BRD15_05740 [Halobacteriales archaeon SW_6_65_15]|nr:MAG: hypothetical protein BRD15_05740 [Halobacteriales archaeon SW_6_65_15]